MIETFPVEVIDAALLRAKPGDIVILRVAAPCTVELSEAVRVRLQAILPPGVKGIVCEEGDGVFEVQEGR